MFSTIAAMAQVERRVIKERIQAGMGYARLRGTKSGGPIGRTRRSRPKERCASVAGPRSQLAANRLQARRECDDRAEGMYG